MPVDEPLAHRLRPQTLDEVVGQNHVLGEENLICQTIASGQPQSLIFWGPPGCGKTTLARIYAKAFNARFEKLSAVLDGVADIRKVVARAEDNQNLNERTVLFIDEIHRFNKAQQDAFLPHVENGLLTLLGATTENPSFSLNNALLSRTQVITLKPLNEDSLEELLLQAEAKIGVFNLTKNAKKLLINMAQGDGRMLLNYVEILQNSTGKKSSKKEINSEKLQQLISTKIAMHDKNGESHYNLISALHKSVRGSDPDATLYWLTRILNGGENPLFVARRLIRMASEDIGLADPNALLQAMAARDAFQMLGSPEGELALAQCAVYLALAPKSNAVYMAYRNAQGVANSTSHLSPPKILLNAPTQLMKAEGYSDGYIYDQDTPEGFSGQHYFPTEKREKFYKPVSRGFEREMQKRIAYFVKLRNKK